MGCATLLLLGVVSAVFGPQPPFKACGFSVPATHAGSVIILIYRVRFLSVAGRRAYKSRGRS